MKYLNWILNTDVARFMYAEDEYDKMIKTGKYRKSVIPAVFCKDGHYVSVQTSETHYCSPRTNRSPWYEVECGFPSVIPPVSWAPYAEEWNVTTTKRIKRFILSCKFVGKWAKKPSDYIRAYKREFTRMVLPPPRVTVYGYIPVELVKEFIKIHGGEDTKRSFNETKRSNPGIQTP